MIATVESNSTSVKPGGRCGADFRGGSLPRSASGGGTVEDMGRRRQGVARWCATHGPLGACGLAERGQKWPQNRRLCPTCENRQEGVALRHWKNLPIRSTLTSNAKTCRGKRPDDQRDHAVGA